MTYLNRKNNPSLLDVIDEAANFFSHGSSSSSFSPFSTNETYCKSSIKEESDKYSFSIEVPGYKKQDVSLKISGTYILIIAENELKGKFSKTLRLPKNIKKESATSKLEDGILYVSLPKQDGDESIDIEIQ